MSDHDDLGRALRDRADTIGAGERPISFDDVKGRAKGIRRRRMAVTGLAAAAVLAVAIPTGLVVADRATTQSDLPPAGTPTPQQSGSPSPGTTDDPGNDVKVVVLDNNTDARSTKPGISYLVKNDLLVGTLDGDVTIQLPNGDDASLTRHYDAIARTRDSWLALWRDDQGRSFVDYIKRGGIVIDTRRATNTLAVSHDGSLAVYATPGGDMVSLSPINDVAITGPDARRPGADPVAVLGSGTCKESQPEGGGCTVFYNDKGSLPAGYYATSHGISDQVGDLRSVGGVSEDGWVDGVVSADDFGSCSVMLDQEAREQWRTCDYTLGQFSPDGKYVLGHPAYRDGIGDGSVAILEARTGKVLVDYKNDQQAQAFIHTAVWDTDGTVLATVFARGSWSLMRMTPQGDLSLVDDLGALGSDMDQVPLVLETRP